jgi:hypothetical protein
MVSTDDDHDDHDDNHDDGDGDKDDHDDDDDEDNDVINNNEVKLTSGRQRGRHAQK